MKKIALFCGIALSLGLASCDDQLPNPPAQEYPQPEIFDAATLKLQQDGFGVTNPLNLNEYAQKGELAPVARITAIENFPDTYELQLPMEVGSDEAFTKVSVVETTITDNVVYVAPASFTDAIRELITKSPEELTVNVRFPGYAVSGNSVMRLGGTDVYYATAQYRVLPYQSYTIEDQYYLVGSFCGWDLNKGLKLERVNNQGSVYDDAMFSVKFDVTAQQAADGFLYKIVPASAVAAGNWTGAMGLVPTITTDDKGVETVQMYGSLVDAPDAESEAGVISQEGPYLLTVDLNAKTYNLSFAIDYLWVPGVGTSSTNFAVVPRLYTTDYITYQGAAHLNKQWWLTGQPGTTGMNFKTAEGTEQTVNGLVTSGQIQNFGDNGGTRMLIGDNGLYWLNVNLANLNYSATHLQHVGLVGAFNGWNAEGAVDLTPDKKFEVWTGTFDLEGEFKVNTNLAWDIDFGSNTAEIGTPNKLDFKGANINVPAGKYDVRVDFSTLPYTITLTRK